MMLGPTGGTTQTVPPAPGMPGDPPAASEPVESGSARWPSVPGYEILGELGRGGMGVVYKARQTGLKRLVALKMILSGEYAGAGEVARFRSEAEAVARLHHENIVQIYEVGEHEGRPFFSLEFCPGGSLDRMLDGTPLQPRDAARLAETLARAVQAAHAAEVVHRDLKPANILLQIADCRFQISDLKGSARRGSPDPADLADFKSAISNLQSAIPKITDFGLAKKLDEGGATASGAMLGTPSYMAPEQAGGARNVGPAADIYALGVILYEFLTGRPPFKGVTALDTIMQVVVSEPVPPSRLQQKVPRDLETICLKCLQKAPARRYLTAGDLAEDLRRFLANEPILARPVGPVERFTRWCKRNPLVAGLTAAVAFALLAGTVFSAYYAIDARQQKSRADQKAILADEKAADAVAEKHRADAIATEAEANLYVARMNLAQTDWENGSVGRILELLEPYRNPPADKADLRGWEWYYQDRLCHADLRTLTGHTGSVPSVAFSSDGGWLASAGEARTIELWNAATGQELRTLTGHTAAVRSVAFSPDGGRLASAGDDRTIKVWDTATGQELRTLQGHTAPVRSVAFSPDGRRLASAGDDRVVKLWDAATGQEERTLTGHTERLSSVAFSPDGSRLASGAWRGEVKIWDVAAGRELRSLRENQGAAVLSVAFSPDGSRLATGSWGSTVAIWDAATGQELRTLQGHTLPVYGVAFSPDGSRVASASGDRTVRLWDAASGKELRILKGHTLPVSSVAFSPNGSRLASASDDGTIKVWDAAGGQEWRSHKIVQGRFVGEVVRDTAGGQEQRPLKGHFVTVRSLAFSPDGRRLASASDDGTIKLWDPATGQEQRTLQGHTGFVLAAAFSPDSHRLASAGQDGTIRLWNPATGQELRTLQGDSRPIWSVAFRPDGGQLVSASADGTVRFWDAAAGQVLRTLQGHVEQVSGVAFTPDGSRLATASDTTRIWDAATGQLLHTLARQGHYTTSVAFSPDGSRLVAGGEDQTIDVWDAATGQLLRTLRGHTGRVYSVAFSPDGRRLASGGADKTIRVWDPVRGQELRTLREESGWIFTVAFHPDGWRLASGSSVGKIEVWDARPLTPELRRQREALGLVEYLGQRFPSQEQVRAAIRSDKGITDEVRQAAHSLLDDYGPRPANNK